MSNKNKLGQEPAYPFEYVKQRIGGAEVDWTNYKGISKREYAAIELRVPDSGEEWIDEMIRKANRRDAAMFAMQGILACNDTLEYFNSESVAKRSFEYADELLKRKANEQA